MRAAYFGTPAIAVPALQALAKVTEVVAVVCQPDRPSGRGMRLQSPAVKLQAELMGLEVHQPVQVRRGKLDAWLVERGIEVVLVMAYGRILPPEVLAAPRLGCLNLHASLLPKYRGAAPINWAIAAGEERSGISLMQMDAGLDTGPVFAQRELHLAANENAGSLSERLAALACDVVLQDLPRALRGELTPQPQDADAASYAPLITSEHTRIRWAQAPESIERLVRALAPQPGAHSQLGEKRLRILATELTQQPSQGAPGTVTVQKGEALVATHGAALRLVQVQLEGRKVMLARDLVNGRSIKDGDQLDSPVPA